MAGLLGPASPTDRKGPNISDTPVGIGGTTQWKLAGLVRQFHTLCAMLSLIVCCWRAAALVQSDCQAG